MPLWRPFLAGDLAAVSAIARTVHPAFPEDDAVFIDRVTIAPQTCLILDIEGQPAGYVLAHPWRLGSVPALNTVLEEIPPSPDTLYIHDLALLPCARGTGAARQVVDHLAMASLSLGTMSLVAVNGSMPFWTRMGFSRYEDETLAAKLASYEPDACYMVRMSVLPDAV